MNYSYKGKILISTPDISGDIFDKNFARGAVHACNFDGGFHNGQGFKIGARP